MRKYTYFLLGLLCGAVFLNGTAVMANSGVLAKISSQIFFLNGEQTELFAYNINGNNYVKLRDAAALFGADIEYIEETNSVHMEIPTKEEIKEIPEETPVVTPDIFIDGRSSSKENFSANANQSIFGDIYTKEAYNTMRQTIADTKAIVVGVDKDGYNPSYSYAHYVDAEFTFTTPGKTDAAMKSVANVLSGYYTYSFGAEPTVKNLYEYPGYRILKVQVNPKYESANAETDEFVNSLTALSEKETVKAIATYIADRIVYNDENVADFFEELLRFKQIEETFIIGLDAKGKIKSKHKLASGGMKSVGVSTHDVARFVGITKPVSCYMGHNHPNGSAKPSEADRKGNDLMMSLCKKLKVEFLDHVIVGVDGAFSMLRNKFLRQFGVN